MKSWITNQLEISHGNHTPLRAMEGLRGVAVFLVFLVHYSSLIEPWLTNSTREFSSYIHSFGHLGVDLFFILSGYLIYGTIISKKTFEASTYAKRRVMRIYPTFMFVFLVYIFLSIIFPNESKLPIETLSLITYIIQNILLLPGLFDITPIITVAWSLSYEIFYYFLIPILIFTFSLKKWSSHSRVIAWFFITILGFIFTFLYGGPVRLLMFVCGIILFEFQRIQNIKLKLWGSTSFILALLLFGIRSVIEVDYHLSLAVVYILFFVFCLNAFTYKSFSYGWLIYSPLRWLGNMSYSYYLIHGLTLKFLFLILPTIIQPTHSSSLIYFGLLPPFFIATLIVSFFLFVGIERPLSITKKKCSEPLTSKLTRT
jgi:exopolysaccharide production protein ExoZ